MNDRDIFIQKCVELNIQLSGEMLTRIDQYAFLLSKWQKKFNLIGPDTVPYIYSRHILDCAQICPMINSDDFVLDIGAGAGLPSIIISIITGAKVHACETVGKKIQFMGEVKRQLKLDDRFTPLNEDVYKLHLNNSRYSVVTSRAFSSVDNILKAGNPLLSKNGKYILLKGSNFDVEKNKSSLIKCMTVKEKDSITFIGGKVLVLK
jgi:16S rRNA (guanine527-N7)-methyltransferase